MSGCTKTQKKLWLHISSLILAAALNMGNVHAKESPLPEVRGNNGLMQLMVDNRAYIALGGDRTEFSYDSHSDQYQCLAGNPLTLKQLSKGERIYQAATEVVR
ncbi:hypothetical protein D3C75_1083040 [compost metagenome]|jgi:hypothetical protein